MTVYTAVGAEDHCPGYVQLAYDELLFHITYVNVNAKPSPRCIFVDESGWVSLSSSCQIEVNERFACVSIASAF